MKRGTLASLLVASALAVGVQNYVFFSSLNEVPERRGDDPEEEEEIYEDGDDSTLAPPEISTEALADWLAGHPGEPRSPFLTAAEARARRMGPTGPGLPTLDGTLVGSHRRVAWINGRAHGEGDWVEGHRIERIEAERVFLVRGEERLALRRAAPAPPAGEGEIVEP